MTFPDILWRRHQRPPAARPIQYWWIDVSPRVKGSYKRFLERVMASERPTARSDRQHVVGTSRWPSTTVLLVAGWSHTMSASGQERSVGAPDVRVDTMKSTRELVVE